MFRRLWQALRMGPAAFMPLFLSPSCFFWNRTKIKPNVLENRLHTQVLESNFPCEDRRDFKQLSALQAYAVAVYDGHGGWQVSQLCQQKLLGYLDDALRRNKEKFTNVDELISTSIDEAFMTVENEFLNVARQSYRYGFGRAARAGSCALVCVVHNNKVYCGNAGDSLGILVEEDNPMVYTEINRELNADNPAEQQRLKETFPNEDDIIHCKRPDNTSCYVKGRLQPSRSIGDLRLKYNEFNNPRNWGRQYEFQPPLKIYTGPYIDPHPEIKVFDLKPNHKWLIMASDGLWEQMGRQEVAQVFKDTPVKEVPQVLIERCLEKAAVENGMTVSELKAKPQGKKRNIHDDISIVVLDLSQQYRQYQ